MVRVRSFRDGAESLSRLRQQPGKSRGLFVRQRQGDERFPGEESFALDGGAEVPLQPFLPRSEGGRQKLQVIGAELFGDAQRIHMSWPAGRAAFWWWRRSRWR